MAARTPAAAVPAHQKARGGQVHDIIVRFLVARGGEPGGIKARILDKKAVRCGTTMKARFFIVCGRPPPPGAVGRSADARARRAPHKPFEHFVSVRAAFGVDASSETIGTRPWRGVVASANNDTRVARFQQQLARNERALYVQSHAKIRSPIKSRRAEARASRGTCGTTMKAVWGDRSPTSLLKFLRAVGPSTAASPSLLPTTRPG